MASVEQRALAEDVKSVHRKLREQLLEGRKAEEVCRVVTGDSLLVSFFAKVHNALLILGLEEPCSRSGDFGQI